MPTLRAILDDAALRAAHGDRLLGVVHAACEQLAEAHDRGELHRDLRPEHIIVDDAGVAVGGWGGAGRDLGYVAPELQRGDGATAQSDLFALGAVLYECLAGRRAFAGATPPPAGCPAPLAKLCLRLLAAKDQRPASAREVAAALAPFVAVQLPAAPLARSSDELTPAPVASTEVPETLRRWTRYEVVGLLGEGGMGRVYRAHDPRLQRAVAIKILSRAHAHGKRFEREAQLMARVDHPNICRVYETGEIGGEPYLAMRLLEGSTLLEVGDELDVAVKARIIETVAEAVHAAHALGLVHRDLKPSNIMLEGDTPYVMDFGLAREISASGLTVTGEVLGTPPFMAPEQARAAAVDARTDVYGLGATLYFLLAGRPPFEGTVGEILSKVLEAEAPAVRSADPTLPAALETIVACCLEKDPERRYPSAAALAADLRRFRQGEPIHARRAGRWHRLRVWARRHRAALLVAAVAVVGSVVPFDMWRRERGREDERAALAQRFGVEIERMRDLMRRAYALPLHDVRPEKAATYARLAKVAADVQRLGEAARAPGEWALGSGYLSVEDYARARDHLAAAWRLGARGPEVAFALSQALGGMYRGDLDVLAPAAPAKARPDPRRQELRDAALGFARQAAGGEQDPSYVEGLVAYYEGRWDDALAGARSSAARTPWFYEARLLEGEVFVARAYDLYFRDTDYAAAVAELERALAAFRAAADVGRSDPAAHAGVCASLVWLMNDDLRRNASPEAHYREAIAACDRAVAADADRAQPWYQKQRAHHFWARHLAKSGRDPRPILDEAEAAAAQVLARDPRFAEAYVVWGNSLRVRGYHEDALGVDPRPTYERAIGRLELALALEPRSYTAFNDLAFVYSNIGEWERKHGLDPRARLDQAIAAYDAAIAIDPEQVAALTNLAAPLGVKGEWEMLHGLDPRPSLQRGVMLLEKALVRNEDPISYQNLGQLHGSLATYALRSGTDATRELDLAEDALRHATRIAPKRAAPHEDLAALSYQRAQQAVARGADPAAFLAAGRAEAARAIALDANRPAYRDVAIRLELLAARVEEAAGRSPAAGFAAAERLLGAQLAAPGYDPLAAAEAELRRRRAEWLLAAGRPARAEIAAGLAACARAAKNDPDDDELWAVRGALELMDGRTTEAEADLDKAIAAAPGLRDKELRPLLERARRGHASR
jgi:eukaryotic-like serine/threonine-protein kinase